MMIVVGESLSASYPADAASIPPARAEVTDFAAAAGVAGEGLEAVRLAVSEALTNAVRHAYPDGRTGAVHVTATMAGSELWVLVADDGCGYRTPAQNPGLGLGLTLIADASDRYIVTERAGGGTEVRMRFPLPSRQPVPA